MYQVIVTSINGKKYYYSYVESDGNMECDDLPPYQDINKARACYWNGSSWKFDEAKYEEIIAEIEARKKAEQEEAERVAAIPDNEELYEMMLVTMEGLAEVTAFIDEVVEPLTELAKLLK